MTLFEKVWRSPDGYDSRVIFSECRRYRYWLGRTWQEDGSRLVFILLNPSTADERVNDPTIARWEQRARLQGYGGIVVCNLFGWRATDPGELLKVEDPIGPDNDNVIDMLLEPMNKRFDSIICGWGPPGAFMDRNARIVELLAKYGIKAMASKVTKKGHPQHPLYIGYDVRPLPFGVRRV